MDVDFFKIGGNSLLGGRVISRLRLAFAVQLTINAIFNHRTIADLALHIQPKLNQQSIENGDLNRRSNTVTAGPKASSYTTDRDGSR